MSQPTPERYLYAAGLQLAIDLRRQWPPKFSDLGGQYPCKP